MSLTITSDDGRAALTISYAEPEHAEWRARYAYTITVDGTEHIAGDDLRGGANSYETDHLADGLRSLVGFLGAWDEAMRLGGPDSENRDLFPPHAHEHVAPYIDEWSAELDDRRT